MNIAFVLNSAVLSATWSSFRDRAERKGEGSACQLDGGILLNVAAERALSKEIKAAEQLKYSDLVLPETNFHVQSVNLVPSMRSRVSKALRNLVDGFELPLVRRSFVWSGCFAMLASVILSGSQPVSAETIPVCSKTAVQSVSPVQGLLAATEVDPVNHALRLGSAWGSYADSDSSHTNIPAQHINIPNGQHSNSAHLPLGSKGHTPQVPPVTGAGV
ncbi:MAG: hypothetical protein ACI376_09085 [Candidatus Bruticola sp.]